MLIRLCNLDSIKLHVMLLAVFKMYIFMKFLVSYQISVMSVEMAATKLKLHVVQWPEMQTTLNLAVQLETVG